MDLTEIGDNPLMELLAKQPGATQKDDVAALKV